MKKVIEIQNQLIDITEVCRIYNRTRSGNNKELNELVFVFKNGMQTPIVYPDQKHLFLMLHALREYLSAFKFDEPNVDEMSRAEEVKRMNEDEDPNE